MGERAKVLILALLVSGGLIAFAAGAAWLMGAP